MARFYGLVGYADSVETEPGVWEEDITYRPYYGEFARNSMKFQTSSAVNTDVNVYNELSIVADPYAENHFQNIRCVEYAGTKWKVTSVEPKRPRLILQLGGVWNGDQN